MNTHARQASRASKESISAGTIPFDTTRLDRLMEEASLDILLVTSKHSIQYIFGGYRYFFYDYMDAHGLSRYLPFFIYIKGQADKAAYIGSPMEVYERDLCKFWVSECAFDNMTTTQSAVSALRYLDRIGRTTGRVGVEIGFLPADAYRVLEQGLPGAAIVDATFTLEVLRAVKSPQELELLRVASEKVIDSILAVFASHGSGITKRQLVDALQREEQNRGLKFEYLPGQHGAKFQPGPL